MNAKVCDTLTSPHLGGGFSLLFNLVKSLNVYSTSGNVIGEWIDGKPLMRKVFQFDFDRAKGVEQSISIDLTKDQVKRLDAYYNETNGSSGLPMYEQTDTDKFSILVKNGNLIFRVGNTWPANGTIIAYVYYVES